MHARKLSCRRRSACRPHCCPHPSIGTRSRATLCRLQPPRACASPACSRSSDAQGGTLGFVLGPVVGRHYAQHRVVQDFLGDVRQHPLCVEPCCARAAQVVRPESRRDPLALGPAAQPRLYTGVRGRTEDKLTGLVLAAQQRERLARERHPVRSVVLRTLLRDVPAIVVHVRPTRALRLANALPVRSRKRRSGVCAELVCQSLRSSSSVSTRSREVSAPPRARWTTDRQGRSRDSRHRRRSAVRSSGSTGHGSPRQAHAPRRSGAARAVPRRARGCAAL